MPPLCPLLVIEDSEDRIQKFQSWLPEGGRLIVASSAGQAIGMLNRTKPGECAALLLDHDLQEQAKTTADTYLSTSNLLNLIVQKLDKHTPIMIHSVNFAGARHMEQHLSDRGFWVTRISMEDLTRDFFQEWLEDVVSLYLE